MVLADGRSLASWADRVAHRLGARERALNEKANCGTKKKS